MALGIGLAEEVDEQRPGAAVVAAEVGVVEVEAGAHGAGRPVAGLPASVARSLLALTGSPTAIGARRLVDLAVLEFAQAVGVGGAAGDQQPHQHR